MRYLPFFFFCSFFLWSTDAFSQPKQDTPSAVDEYLSTNGLKWSDSIQDTLIAGKMLEEAKALIDSLELNKALILVEEAEGIFLTYLGDTNTRVADALNIRGGVFYRLAGQDRNLLDSAYIAFRQALDMYIHVLGEQDVKVGVTYGNMGLVLMIGGKLKLAVTNMEKSSQILKGRLSNDHIRLLEVQNNMGILYMILGDFNKAIRLFAEILPIQEKKYGSESFVVGRTLMNLGSAYEKSGQYKLSEKQAIRSLNILIKTRGKDHIDTVEPISLLGILSVVRGFSDQAFFYFQQALAILKNNNALNGHIAVRHYINIGIAYTLTRDYETAFEYWYKAINIIGEDTPNAAIIFSNMGLIYEGTGQLNEAMQSFEKAEKVFSKTGQNYYLRGVFVGMGEVFAQMGEYDKAIEYQEKALKLVEAKDLNHIHALQAYLNLGINYRVKKKYETAYEYLRKAEEKCKNNFGEQYYPIATIKKQIALIELEKGNREKALRIIDEAMPNLNYHFNGNIDSLMSYSVFIDLIATKCQIWHELFEQTSDLKYLRSIELESTLAIRALNKLKEIVSNSKDQIALDVDLNIAAIFEIAINANYILFEKDKKLRYIGQAFHHCEESKAFIIREAISKARIRNDVQVPDSLLAEEYTILFKISQNKQKRHTELDTAFTKEQRVAIETKYAAKIFDEKQRLNQLKQTFQSDYPKYYNLKYDNAVISKKEIQASLSAQQSILEYFVGDSSIYIFTINQDDFHIEKIAKDFPLKDWVADFRGVNDPEYYELNVELYTDRAYQLYQKLVAPVAERLKENVIIIPDGVLGYIPFGALLVQSPKDPGQFREHHYWIRDKRIHYAYSATLAQQLKNRDQQTAPRTGLVAFAPFYEGDTTQLQGLSRRLDVDRAMVKPLPASGKEVSEIQKTTKGKAFYYKDATEEQFRKYAPESRFIHLATHGKADDRSGDASYLLFSQQKDSIENEILYVRDLYNLPLKADMVVLSACETGIGELQGGEGIISLARGFTYAGAKSIITTLWRVQDESSKDLMISFYRYLDQGLKKDQALRQAKLDFIQNAKHDLAAHPMFWSGVIAVGDMEAVAF